MKHALCNAAGQPVQVPEPAKLTLDSPQSHQVFQRHSVTEGVARVSELAPGRRACSGCKMYSLSASVSGQPAGCGSAAGTKTDAASRAGKSGANCLVVRITTFSRPPTRRTRRG
jgi:hypothetical protein